ncbi:MAG: S-adenosylmethionine decarboxylase [Patescibacteria group bacterium]|nr:S-adenosylmethionine decarboxylase [Patescibacteria group bacterium]
MKNEKLKTEKKIYGKELILDLDDCDPKIIRSRRKILEYSNKLCQLIKVKKYGKPICKRFALHSPQAAGYSLVQLIETSSITVHFSELWNRAFINIFSCKLFDHKIAIDFTKKFFKAKKIKTRILIR